jgi:hypothetical protein
LSLKLNLFMTVLVTVRRVHIMLNELFQSCHTAYTMDSSGKLSHSSPSYLSTHKLYSTPLSWQRRFPVNLGSLSLLTAVPYSTLVIEPITARACRCWAFSEQSTVKTAVKEITCQYRILTFITVTTNSRHRTHILRSDITLMTYQVRIPARNLLSWPIDFSVFHYFLWENIHAIYYNKPRPFF